MENEHTMQAAYKRIKRRKNEKKKWQREREIYKKLQF